MRHGSSLAFHSLTAAQLLHAIHCRSEQTGLFNPRGRARNPWLNIALGGTAAVHLLFALLPSTRKLLGTTVLRPADVLVIGAAAGVPMLINELIKLRPSTDENRPSISAPQELPK
jgi:Ca2+-transporting ATPase